MSSGYSKICSFGYGQQEIANAVARKRNLMIERLNTNGAARLSGLRLFLVIYQILQVPTPLLFLLKAFK